MSDSTLVFIGERDARPEIVANFGVFAGREATVAEIERLGEMLVRAVGPVEIVSEQRYEFGRDGEATVHQVRVDVPSADDARLRWTVDAVEAWTRECIAERSVFEP